MAHDVFVCHPSDDRATANAVVATLEADRVRCWIAPRDVLPSEEWADAIVRAIAGSKLLILVFSGHSNDSRHVMREVEQAVGRAIPILPFRIEDVEPSPALEYYIGGTHWLDALTPPLAAHLERLVETVRILLPHEQQLPAMSSPTDAQEPPSAPESMGAMTQSSPDPDEHNRDVDLPTPGHLGEGPDAVVVGDPAITTPEVRPGGLGDAKKVAASFSVSSPVKLLTGSHRHSSEFEEDLIATEPAADQADDLPTETMPIIIPAIGRLDRPAPTEPEAQRTWRVGSREISIDDQTLRVAAAAALAILVGAVGFLGIRGLVSGGDTQVLGATATTAPGGDVTNDGFVPLAIPPSTSTSTTIPATTAPATQTTSTTSTSTTTVPTTTTTTVPATTTTTVARTTTTKRTTTTTTPVVVLVARNDSYTRTDRGQVCFDVKANDAGSGALTVISVGSSEFGSVSAASCGVIYSPPDVITRTDAFTDVFSYTVKDSTGATATATVTVSVR